MDYDKFDKLIQDSQDLSYGFQRTEMVEQAVAMADAADDVYSAVFARCHLMEAATFGGSGEKALTAFGWVLAKFDEDPDVAQPAVVLWRYKWIYSSIFRYPSIPLEKIAQVGADIRRRFVDYGDHLGVVDSIDACCFQFLGCYDEVKDAYRKWIQSPRDELSDCEACDHNTRIELLNERGHYREAVQASEIIIKQGLSCAEVPELTYAELLFPLSKLGQIEKAKEYHRKGYQLSKGQPGLAFAHSNHLQFLVHCNELGKAKECFSEHLEIGLQQKIPHRRLVFLIAAVGFFRKTDSDRPDLLKDLKPTASVPADCQRSQELWGWLEAEATDLLQQFDKRNGNQYLSNYYQQKIDWMLE